MFRDKFHKLFKALARPAGGTPPMNSKGIPSITIVFEIATGPWLDRRATRALALINNRSSQQLQHTGHWRTFYRHDEGCASEDRQSTCTCATLVAECHPIGEDEAARLRNDATLYDAMTIMETEPEDG